jgi:O-antigen biosynthesis protein
MQKAAFRLFVPTTMSLVDYEDALAVDWRAPHPSVSNPRRIGPGRQVVAWIMSPAGTNSGGHQNIFRFIKFMEDSGHEVRIYLYSAITPDSPAEVAERVRTSTSYTKLAASIENFPANGIPADVDAVFATGWETAYRSYRDTSTARRFYFVQDFEPLFYPTSSESVLAENTYRFGFTGITAGEWLAHKLRTEYGMATSSFEFGADSSHYSITNTSRRDGVFFYARPETARRGFELGSMALDLVSRDRPGTPIILAGQKLRNIKVPYPHESLGNVQVGQLNELYNRCAAGVVLSLTNMSLLPLELLSAGVIPVVNDGDNNRLVSSNPFIEYTEPNPRALADRIISILDREEQAAHARLAAASVAVNSWAHSGEQFMAAFDRSMNG